jgi:hypothetical protein
MPALSPKTMKNRLLNKKIKKIIATIKKLFNFVS